MTFYFENQIIIDCKIRLEDKNSFDAYIEEVA